MILLKNQIAYQLVNLIFLFKEKREQGNIAWSTIYLLAFKYEPLRARDTPK